jgi:hypothetical protein
MTTSTATGTRPAYTVGSVLASRSIEVRTMPYISPIVFVVDDDISVRESLPRPHCVIRSLTPIR